MVDASYVLPLKSSEPATDLDEYLAFLGHLVEVIVVDGSPPEVFEANRARWRDLHVLHVPVDADLVTEMGKVGGVLTGVRRASCDVVVIADDDVRWTAPQLREAVLRTARAEVLRPQNHFTSACWHTRWDTGRTLIARATGGDWPGTMVVDRDALVRAGGYDGSVLFENLELVRTLKAAGGREIVALDLLVARLPPTTEHFWSQRVRQAYDEWARPSRMVAQLALAPLILIGRTKATLAVIIGAVAVAEAGRRRRGGTEVFEATAALWAPCWVAERAVTSWLALGARLLGGARYGSGRLRRAANRRTVLRRRVTNAGQVAATRSALTTPGWGSRLQVVPRVRGSARPGNR